MSTQNTLGSRIELGRTQQGLTVAQLAGRIGVRSRTLENWEGDRSAPRGDKVVKLSGVLQVPLVWLLTGDVLSSTNCPPSNSETARIADKLDRAVTMQQQLAALLIEVTADVTRLQRDLDSDEDIAA